VQKDRRLKGQTFGEKKMRKRSTILKNGHKDEKKTEEKGGLAKKGLDRGTLRGTAGRLKARKAEGRTSGKSNDTTETEILKACHESKRF